MAKQEPRPVHGKVVAITGAARGIGRATATAFAREGARVAIGDLDGDLARQAAEELGGGCIGLDLNVTDRESFAAFVEAVERELGPIDVMVNNAGIMPLAELHEETDEAAIRCVDINLHGVITGTKLALRSMRPRRMGHIVNIASFVGVASPPGGATYVATKHAVVGLTESAWMENRDLGIEFSIIMPGVVNTELTAGMPDTPGVQKVEPEEVAAAIVGAVKVPEIHVFVPPMIGRMHKITFMLPRRTQEFIARRFKGDRVLLDLDHAQRAAYEARAAASEPGVEESGAAERAAVAQD